MSMENVATREVLAPLIELKEVSKTFRLESGSDVKVLENVNLAVREGEVVALLGPSGSGKSTCLRIMSGLIEPTKGRVRTRGHRLEGVNYDVALVFQSFALFPWETVFSNIALALKPMGLSESEVRTRVKRAVDLVGLEGFEEAYPRELSGGMKQRVGIARALVMERPILFLDEPFSALDVLTADTLRYEMVNLFTNRQTATRSMVLVTHNIQEAVLMAGRILVMGAHPGHIRREFINDLSYPRDDQSAQFRLMVSQIHGLITETLMPDTPQAQTSVSPTSTLREPPVEALPNVQINEVIGLVEAISDQGGRADIFELAQKTGKDFGKTLYMVKAAELFDLVDTPKQTVLLTEAGRRFVEGDINLRKKMLHDLFGNLRIAQMTANLLRKQEGFRLSVDVLADRVGEWLPNENPSHIIETLVSWGRFAEYFGYSDDSKEIYLDLGQETV